MSAFASSERRLKLRDELRNLIDELSSRKITCELWIDGSFLSKKEDPGDVDLTIVIDGYSLNELEEGDQQFLRRFAEGKRFGGNLDTYIFPSFALGDPRYDKEKAEYWGSWWGKGYDNMLKGYLALSVGETDVGIRLARL